MSGIARFKTEISELNAALLVAQAQFAPARRSGFSNEWRKPYSTVSDYLDVVTKPLNDAGILLLQPAWVTQQGVVVQTQLIHVASGQTLSTEIEYPTKEAVLEMSGAIGLARRDALRSLLGLQSDDEDATGTPKGTIVHTGDLRVEESIRKTADAIVAIEQRAVSNLEATRLRSDCTRLAALAAAATGHTRGELLAAAGMPEGPLDGAHLHRYRAWLITTIDIAGGELPDWANDPVNPEPVVDDPPPSAA